MIISFRQEAQPVCQKLLSWFIKYLKRFLMSQQIQMKIQNYQRGIIFYQFLIKYQKEMSQSNKQLPKQLPPLTTTSQNGKNIPNPSSILLPTDPYVLTQQSRAQQEQLQKREKPKQDYNKDPHVPVPGQNDPELQAKYYNEYIIENFNLVGQTILPPPNPNPKQIHPTPNQKQTSEQGSKLSNFKNYSSRKVMTESDNQQTDPPQIHYNSKNSQTRSNRNYLPKLNKSSSRQISTKKINSYSPNFKGPSNVPKKPNYEIMLKKSGKYIRLSSIGDGSTFQKQLENQKREQEIKRIVYELHLAEQRYVEGEKALKKGETRLKQAEDSQKQAKIALKKAKDVQKKTKEQQRKAFQESQSAYELIGKAENKEMRQGSLKRYNIFVANVEEQKKNVAQAHNKVIKAQEIAQNCSKAVLHEKINVKELNEYLEIAKEDREKLLKMLEIQ